jgi:hypothetical protein
LALQLAAALRHGDPALEQDGTELID